MHVRVFILSLVASGDLVSPDAPLLVLQIDSDLCDPSWSFFVVPPQHVALHLLTDQWAYRSTCHRGLFCCASSPCGPSDLKAISLAHEVDRVFAQPRSMSALLVGVGYPPVWTTIYTWRFGDGMVDERYHFLIGLWRAIEGRHTHATQPL